MANAWPNNQEIEAELGPHSIVLPPEQQSLENFPDGWGIRIEVQRDTDLSSGRTSALLTELKNQFGFILLICESPWKSADPVFEQVQKSEDFQIPHLEYIRVPTCAILVPAGKPIRRSQTLLISEEVFKDCLTELADEFDEEVVKHNGSFRLRSWINNYPALRNDSARFTEIMLEKHRDRIFIHNWSPDHEKTQMLLLCNGGDHAATTYHCRFGPAHDMPAYGGAAKNLFIKKLNDTIEPGDFVRV